MEIAISPVHDLLHEPECLLDDLTWGEIEVEIAYHLQVKITLRANNSAIKFKVFVEITCTYYYIILFCLPLISESSSIIAKQDSISFVFN